MPSLLHLANLYYYNAPDSSRHDFWSHPANVAIFIAAIIAYIIFTVIVMWRVFTKAHKPGWAAIVPFYNQWVLAEIAGKPGWWGLYTLVAWIPVVGWVLAVVVSLILALGIARNFGKSDLFGVFGLWLFSIVGYIILAFGSATYKGSPAAPAGRENGSSKSPTTPVE